MSEEIYSGLLQRIEETEQLIEECKSLADIVGIGKLQRKIEAELKFLKRLTKNPGKLKEEHVRSSNIYHLSAIVRSCKDMKSVVKVLETFPYLIEGHDGDYDLTLVVDIVADYGKTWVKVATRNPHHLYLTSIGNGKYGRKSIIEQVEDMIECASQNPHMFVPPKIVLHLAAGVTKELKELLDDLNVVVIGNLVNTNCEDNFKDPFCNTSENSIDTEKNILTDIESISLGLDEISISNDCAELTEESVYFNIKSIPQDAVINLDVSTFLAYVSNMTNGHSDAKYKEKLLMDLAEMERARPVKIILDQLFKGRKLVCCETAHKDFLQILATVGGPAEGERASQLLKNVTVIPDTPSTKAQILERTSKIKDRAKIVFGTGDSIKAITLTANLGFLRAAESQGVKFVAFVHESRALTECKELKQNE